MKVEVQFPFPFPVVNGPLFNITAAYGGKCDYAAWFLLFSFSHVHNAVLFWILFGILI
jgi:hypothetical protein